MLDTNSALSHPIALVHSDEYANWVFSENHPTQGRRFTIAAKRLTELAKEQGIGVTTIEADYLPTVEQLEYAHDREYIDHVLEQGISDEWVGERKDLGRLAQRMAGGTLLAVDALQRQHARIAVNFAGAKHHAKRDHSSGFCVFADFAIAAHHVLTTSTGLPVRRIAILDIDAHHGDGTEELLAENQSVLTFSIHDRSIFPGTGHHDDPDQQIYNRALPANSGDPELQGGVHDFVGITESFDPDMIFLVIGADGLVGDPLSTLNYTIEGMEAAIRHVRVAFPRTPLLFGGAGGYQPDDETPQAWARMVMAAATT